MNIKQSNADLHKIIADLQAEIASHKQYTDELHESKRLLNEAQRIAKLGTWAFDLEQQSIRWSDEVFRIAGMVPRDEAPAFEEYLEIVHPDDRDKLGLQLEKLMSGGDGYELELRHLKPDGTYNYVLTKAETVFHNGKAVSIIGSVLDITEQKKIEEKLKRAAEYDHLTEIPNRNLFTKHLKYAISQAKRNHSRLALLFIDLDDFKPVNDTYGHKAGDLLLKASAKRIQECIRESDCVGRIGGDEFMVLLSTVDAYEDALMIAEKIHHALSQPFKISGYPDLSVTSSSGVSIYPDHATNEDDLIMKADKAMYKIKEAGRNSVGLFVESE